MKKKQSFIDVPGSGLEAPRFVRTAYACWGPAFGKNVEYSARYLGRSPWAWGALKVTLISFKVVPRLKFHRPSCRRLSQCPQECLYHCILFFFSPTQMWELLCTILIWCWSHLKNTLYLCMLPSVRETSSQKACFCFQESPPSPKAFSDMETFKMLSFLPASG